MTLWYALFLLATSLGLFGATYVLLKVDIRQKEREIIDARVKEYQACYEAGGLESLRDCVSSQRAKSPDVFFVRVADAQNQTRYVAIPSGRQGQHPGRIEQGPQPHPGPWLSVLGEDQQTFWTLSSSILFDGLTLQVGLVDAEGQAILKALRWTFWGIILPLLLLGVLGGGLLTYRAMAPVRQMTATVQDILQAEKSPRRVPARKGRGEMNELAGLFNQMLDKNDALIRAMHESLDNVAHDLRTPMTRLRSSAEQVLDSAAGEAELRGALEDCLEEAERVTTMLNILMDVAEAEAGALHIKKTAVPLREMVRDILELYEILSEEKSIQLVNQTEPGQTVSADPPRIQQAIANLVDNALKYSPAGTTVTLASHTDGRGTAIAVSDQGMGITSDELPRIWDRLYRGDRSRTRQGLGLGLSLVRAVVQAHGGTVSVASTVDRGSVFTIWLPR